MRQLFLEIFVTLSLMLLVSFFVRLLNLTTTNLVGEASYALLEETALQVTKTIYDAASPALFGKVSGVVSFRTEASDIYFCAGSGWLVAQKLQAPTVKPPSFTASFIDPPILKACIYAPSSGIIIFSITPASMVVDDAAVTPTASLYLSAGVHCVTASFTSTSVSVTSPSNFKFFLAVSTYFMDTNQTFFTYPAIGKSDLIVVPYCGYIGRLNVTAYPAGAAVKVEIHP